MDQNTQEKIKQRIKELPYDVQEALGSVAMGEIISNIGKKYTLLIDQEDRLYMEIFLALLGFEATSDLANNISKNVGVSEETARLMTVDINDAIFIPIRESLQQIEQSMGTEAISNIESQERSQVLDEIENPIPTKPTTMLAQIPERELVNKTTTDNFLAKKMSFGTSAPQNTSTNPITKKYIEDPYREPTN